MEEDEGRVIEFNDNSGGTIPEVELIQIRKEMKPGDALFICAKLDGCED